jgi:anti-sigma factor RsiW
MTSDLAGELSSARAGRLAQHVERCEGCRRERAAYTALDRALDALPLAAPLPPRLEQDTLRRIRLAGAEEAPAGGGLWRWRWLRVAAPALAGAVVLVLAVRATEPPAEPIHAKSPAVSGASRQAAVPSASRQAAAVPAPAQTAGHRRVAERVPSQPPPDLAARPDLFINLPVLRNMEKLQHYEAIQTTTLDGQAGDHSSG